LHFQPQDTEFLCSAHEFFEGPSILQARVEWICADLRSELLGHRFPSTHPMHEFTTAIAQRIYPEILSERISPTQPLGATALLLSQQCEQGGRIPFSTRAT
jgi:hypothetical protein